MYFDSIWQKKKDFLRTNSAINLHLARQKIVTLLTRSLGEIRDYNGGMMIKQNELLAEFKEAFCQVNDQELLENFFYSLEPIESQATIPLPLLCYLFQLFFSHLHDYSQKKKMYSFDFREETQGVIAVFGTDSLSLRSFIRKSLDHVQAYHSSLVSFSLCLEGRYYLGYLCSPEEKSVQRELKEIIFQEIDKWEKRRQSKRMLRLAIHDILSLDPRIGIDQGSRFLLGFLFRGLTYVNAQGKVHPSVAHSWTISEDGTQYTFKLRMAYWSDGSQVTAYDFEYAWKAALSPKLDAFFVRDFYVIKNARLIRRGEIGN